MAKKFLRWMPSVSTCLILSLALIHCIPAGWARDPIPPASEGTLGPYKITPSHVHPEGIDLPQYKQPPKLKLSPTLQYSCDYQEFGLGLDENNATKPLHYKQPVQKS